MALLGQAAGADTTSKPYTANITPHVVAGGSTTSFTATLVNETSTQQLGSADITAPSGFVVTNASAGTFTSSAVRLRDLSLPPGGTKIVTITAEVPCSASVSSWQVIAKQSNNFSGPPGNNLSLRASGSDLTVTVVGACHLNFATQPADAVKGSTITTTPFNSPTGGAVQVEVLDGNNNRVTSSTAAISVALDPTSPNPAPGAVLSGTLTTNAVAGVASFSNLSINLHGVYKLRATSTGLTSATSAAAFTIWDSVAACPVGGSCQPLTVADGKNFSATFSGSGSTTPGFLMLSVGQDAPATLDCGDSYNHAPVVTNGSMYQFNSTAPKTMVGRIDKSIVQQTPNNGAAFYQVCFESDKPFTSRDGTLMTPDPSSGVAGPALLPDCKAVQNKPPCVQSITKNNSGDIVITILLPADDPQRWR
jgi:hypothetical protein